MYSTPLLSIGLFVFNGERFLGETLDPTWTAGRDFAIENGRNAGG